ncbi:MAG TPA: hypothetical protein VLF89_05485 [Candidatus Saccharimonadales bacterium]|nr:hypothetical protein [Candidatus Saccharimonadales bacterium]
MKVKCITNSGKFLSKKNILLGNSAKYGRDYLMIGKIYTVYGIIWVKGTINYLIAIDENTPFFEPGDFFEIIGSSIPSNWFYNSFKEGNVEVILGYKELVLNPKHNIELALRESVDDLKIFYHRKWEIDEWEKKENK